MKVVDTPPNSKLGHCDRIKESDHDKLFTGEIWTGKDAVELGLVDGIHTVDGFIRENYGGPKDVKVKRFLPPSGGFKLPFQSILSGLSFLIMPPVARKPP